MKVRLRNRVTLAFAAATAALAVVELMSIRATAESARDGARVAQAVEVMAGLSSLLSTVTDAETGPRGFTLTGDETYLEPYVKAQAVYHDQIQLLRSLTIDNDVQQQNLDELAELIPQRLSVAAGVVQARREKGIDAARELILSGEGKRTQNAIRTVIARMEEEERRLLVTRRMQSAASVEVAGVVTIACGALAVFMFAIAGLVLAREFRARQRAEAGLLIRNAELQCLTERAQSADRLKSAFLSTMSHELRTPLNSIIGFTGILRQELPGPLNAEQKKQLAMAQGSARHLLALINDVLDISKIEAGQMDVAVEPVDLYAVTERAASALGPLAQSKGLSLRVQLQPDVGMISGDERRVEQILLNLLANAVRFTHIGGVLVTAERDGLRVRLCVCDTGVGIKPDDIANLFQPFRQVESGLNRPIDGTGLGLAISRRLAALMGGTITVSSEWGKGSTFVFDMPAVRAAAVQERRGAA